jgi:hypothetical protein
MLGGQGACETRHRSEVADGRAAGANPQFEGLAQSLGEHVLKVPSNGRLNLVNVGCFSGGSGLRLCPHLIKLGSDRVRPPCKRRKRAAFYHSFSMRSAIWTGP